MRKTAHLELVELRLNARLPGNPAFPQRVPHLLQDRVVDGLRLQRQALVLLRLGNHVVVDLQTRATSGKGFSKDNKQITGRIPSLRFMA